jgi:hypothetical protein
LAYTGCSIEGSRELNGSAEAESPSGWEDNMELHGMASRIALWSTDRLIPFARHPRTRSEVQIAASIAEFGFNTSFC